MTEAHATTTSIGGYSNTVPLGTLGKQTWAVGPENLLMLIEAEARKSDIVDSDLDWPKANSSAP